MNVNVASTHQHIAKSFRAAADAAIRKQHHHIPCARTSSSSDSGGESQNVQSTGHSPIATTFSRFTERLFGTPAQMPVTFTLPSFSIFSRSAGELASNMQTTVPFKSVRPISPCSRMRFPTAKAVRLWLETVELAMECSASFGDFSQSSSNRPEILSTQHDMIFALSERCGRRRRDGRPG